MSARSRSVIVASVIAATSVIASPLAGHAIKPVDMVILVVTDCKTGQPIRAGEAVFSAPRFHAGAVVPIENGRVGPIGLGDTKWVVIVTSPGYRELHRVFQANGAGVELRTINLCLHGVAGSPQSVVTTTYAINVSCSPVSGQVCNPPYTTIVTSNDVMNVQFTAGPTNCSSIIVAMGVDGSIFTSTPLAPGESTPSVAFSPVNPGQHTITVQATGVLGGCNTGVLASWAGTLTVTTSSPFGPTSREQCKKGGWRNFTNPAFKNEGDCVSYASTAGRNPAG